MIALSTCWQSSVTQSGRDLVENLKALGFNEIELEYQITPAILAELKSALKLSDVRPVSLRNFCPMPEVAPEPGADVWSFSSVDPEERKTAITYTKRAIKLASELGVKALIVHCGQVQMDPRTNELRETYDAGEIEAPAGQRLLGEIKTERSANIGKCLERVEQCLEPLAATASDAGVKICLENQYYAHEIPSSDDLETLLSFLDNDTLGYWHDIGHASVQENLGLDSQTAFLGRYREKIFGVHLHDVVGYKDHLAPGDGDVDFAFVNENLPNDVLQVLEIQPTVTADQIRSGLNYLAKAGIT